MRLRPVRTVLTLAFAVAACSDDPETGLDPIDEGAALNAVPIRTPDGKTVAFGLSRSGSAGVTGGLCGTRLQCFKTAITEANANTAPSVEKVALVLLDGNAEQDVNMKLSGKQLLIAPDADPNGNGTPDFVDAVTRVSLGGGTCFTCALQAAEWAFESATPGSPKVIVLISERVKTFQSTGYTSSGVPTGYPPMELSQMTFSDPNSVVHAFAVGSGVRCDSDPNGYGSLNAAAALTPGGTCTNVDGFDGLGAVIAAAVTR